MFSAVAEKLGGCWASGLDAALEGEGLTLSPGLASLQPRGPEEPAEGFWTSVCYGSKQRKGEHPPWAAVSTARGECWAKRFVMYGPPFRWRGAGHVGLVLRSPFHR